MDEKERFYDEGQILELIIYEEDTTNTEVVFSEGIIQLISQDDIIADGINGEVVNNKSIVFSLEEGLSEGIDYQISGIKFEIKGKGKRASKYAKKKISLNLTALRSVNSTSRSRDEDPPGMALALII